MTRSLVTMQAIVFRARLPRAMAHPQLVSPFRRELRGDDPRGLRLRSERAVPHVHAWKLRGACESVSTPVFPRGTARREERRPVPSRACTAFSVSADPRNLVLRARGPRPPLEAAGPGQVRATQGGHSPFPARSGAHAGSHMHASTHACTTCTLRRCAMHACMHWRSMYHPMTAHAQTHTCMHTALCA